jgi:hypothetical protein
MGKEIMRVEIIHNKLRDLNGKQIFFFISLLSFLIIASGSQADVMVGKVTSIHGDVIELSLGSEKGIKSGDSGRVYYTIRVGEKEKPIFIAKFKITHLSEKSSMAQIEDSTGEVKAGYSVEVVVKESVRLEVKSEPPGAKVYIDGKESGDTPLALSDIKTGRHQIRVVKEGYESYEVSVETGVGRKEVMANLKKVVRKGELLIRTVPTKATIYLNEKSVGTSPYEGKGLSPGKYKIRVTQEGYEPWGQEVTVKADEKLEVLASLKSITGRLVIRTQPHEANIYIGGKLAGTGSYEGNAVLPGTYKVRIVKEGYETWEKDITLKPGEIVELPVELALMEGELIVIAQPSWAKIYINGQFVRSNLYVGKDLRPGLYSVQVVKEGYETWKKDLRVEPGKKIEVLAKLEEIDWTKKSCGAPVWNIGDKWTYKNTKGEIYTCEVVKIEEDLYVAKIEGQRHLLGYDKKTMNNNFLVETSGKRVENRTPFRKLYDFPIVIGKKWSDTTTSVTSVSKTEATFSSDFQIEGIEEITTPAGTFKAFKIYYKQTVISPQRGSGWVRIWYSPVIKNWIRREVEKSPFWRKATWLQDAELISCQLK